MKIAISGFGRIGKSFLKAAIASGSLGKDFDVVAINTRSDVLSHIHLFKYDSIYGTFNGKVEARNGNFVVNGYEIKWIQETHPEKLDWKDIDLVIESSGKNKSRDDASTHLKAGAKRVLITAPGKFVDATIVPGVNLDILNDDMKVISLASCTTNCLAPILKVINDKFGIEKGFMSTIHALTNDQNIVDSSHTDLRRARAGGSNIIPTTTGAASAIGEVIPELKGKLDGVAFRVPVHDGSINDITLVLNKETTADLINKALKEASENELSGILGVTDEPIVSSDIIGRSESSIVDLQLTKCNGRLAKISAWYDNEYGYSCRIVDFVKRL